MTCIFRLVTVDGAPAEPPSLTALRRAWRRGCGAGSSASGSCRRLRRRTEGRDALSAGVLRRCLVCGGLSSSSYFRRSGDGGCWRD